MTLMNKFCYNFQLKKESLDRACDFVPILSPVRHWHSSNGKDVYKFAVTTVPKYVVECIEASGKSAEEIVEQYYGAAVWASDEDQEKHPAFVFVPAFTGTVVDDNWNTSDQIETAVNAIRSLTDTYSIDENRLYTTGQSMGCMTSLYLNSKYPDLFAASLFVSGQWDQSVLDPLADASFFYITAGGDEKASGGQAEVMEMLDEADVSYSYGEWNAQNSEDEQNDAAEEMISEGNTANFIRFETGSVLNGGQGMEHMASFNYAYKLTAVRDWLFEQTK